MAFNCAGAGIACILLMTAVLAQQVTAARLKRDASPAVSTCTEGFANQTPENTMCKEDNVNVVETGVSEGDQEVILEYHNKVRREVLPVATDLAALTWDVDLAAMAQKHAQQCTSWHDKNRRIPAFGKSVGQNIAAGQVDWPKAMGAWFKEGDIFKYGQDPKVYIGNGGWREIGHYTQMVSNRAYRVGCGFAFCENVKYGRFYVCNYAQGQLSFKYPYTNGTTRCSACSDSCENGLCDCGGHFCFNKGKLDINSCTCNCQRNYEEADCSRLECPAEDRGACGTRWPVSYCTRFSNVPFDCPIMCGKCPQQ